jgi:hypothetical protein
MSWTRGGFLTGAAAAMLIFGIAGCEERSAPERAADDVGDAFRDTGDAIGDAVEDTGDAIGDAFD